ncbi:UDP-N-acetylglucosamine 4,6-dehydratase family protein [Parvularcula sp. IMCC14364]|uniref:UDP-N-acetylglucosamine 4,6-dehydratase family protein n=1 Tax=Parvularcula sp. IMCC14364 TaxID=3067902 RepID=UPI002740DA31|nr:polysaccharide biosynthesis protein [Parvularcula sp. IMCC14364]
MSADMNNGQQHGFWDRLRALLNPNASMEAPTEMVSPRLAPCDLSGLQMDSTQLLRRPPRSIDLHAASTLMSGKRILITGAGGTIGSELVRQAASFKPSKLVLVDNSEFNLYQIDMEMRELGLDVPVEAYLVDVCRRNHLTRLFENTKPEIVLHAAAFKHVPIVEQNQSPAALTNVLGAKNVFDASVEFKSEAVVFISTDKAVNPTSFMGATKRIAELYAQALDVAQTDTRFVTVRFGNVLGSTGSVAPLFERQIAAGGPVTVTHPDISRYFMTTREAVQLVLQAASLDHGQRGVVTHDGRIFVLDMGEPIRIVELAKRMIEAHGLKPDEDIKIEFTGLRAGEKLFEEIFLDTEKLIKTGADGVLLASPTMIDLPLLNPRFADVISYAQSCDEVKLAEAVHHLVPEFRGPSAVADMAASQTAAE